MGRQTEVLEMISTKKFRKICFKHLLDSKEMSALKKVLRGYEIMDKTVFDKNNKEKGLERREAAKKAVFQNAVERLDVSQQKKICWPLSEILSLEF